MIKFIKNASRAVESIVYRCKKCQLSGEFILWDKPSEVGEVVINDILMTNNLCSHIEEELKRFSKLKDCFDCGKEDGNLILYQNEGFCGECYGKRHPKPENLKAGRILENR